MCVYVKQLTDGIVNIESESEPESESLKVAVSDRGVVICRSVMMGGVACPHRELDHPIFGEDQGEAHPHYSHLECGLTIKAPSFIRAR